MFDWGAVGEKSVIGVVTAIVLAALAGLWNWASGGGVVRFFGGMTRTELASFQTVPAGAVMAFDLPQGCPTGWNRFEPATSRMLVGAVAGRGDATPNKDMNGIQLTARQYRADGGEEFHTLLGSEMPKHTHAYVDWGSSEAGSCAFSGCNGKGGNVSKRTEDAGEGKPHNSMPPFIALHYCRKD
jgi:hypothetical protein